MRLDCTLMAMCKGIRISVLGMHWTLFQASCSQAACSISLTIPCPM